MSYKSLLRNGAFIIAASILTLAACKRSSTDNTTATPALTSADDNGGYASDAAKLETTSNDVISIADVAAAGDGSTLRTTASSCATVTNDTATGLLIINFGTTDCLCVDGKYRKGEIIVHYTGRYKDSGSVHTISYSSYFVNDNQVSGSKTVTNQGMNSSGQVWYTVDVNDSMTLTSDSVITWTAHRTRTWLTGYTTATRTDDSYSIADQTGDSTVLKRANGHVFNFTITSPLTIAYGCDFIEAGTLQISSTTFTDGYDRILNYSYGLGSTPGECDDLAQLTIGTHTYVITLH